MRQVKLALVAASLSVALGQTSQAAVYEIIELPTQDIALSSFSASINDTGDIAIVTNDVINPPIDLTLLDFESETLVNGLSDIENARNGVFNAEDLAFLNAFVRSQAANTGQELADDQSYVVNAGATSSDDIEFVPGLDEIDPELNGYSGSTDTRIREINAQGVMVGVSEGKYETIVYTNEEGNDVNYVVQPFGSRGFISINEETYTIAPESDVVGAFTEAFDVNSNLLVAGFEAIDPIESRLTSIENCDDDETRGDIPVEFCYQQLINAGALTTFQLRGVLWQLNEQGEVLDRKVLGLHITPEEDDTNLYVSRALAVNNNGIAAGEATDFFQGDSNRTRTFPAVFRDDEVISFIDHEEYGNGVATDINNNNLVIGQAGKVFSNVLRSKFFVYDVDADSIVFPNDFFNSSTSLARAINDNNIVVGEGEVDTTLNNARRRNAFIYDVEADNFQNLNDLVDCDTPYTIVQANDINNSNQIAATAIINRAVLNIKGEPELDDNGDAVIEDVIVSVLLDPIPNGEVEDCGTPPEELQERSGGSLGWLATLIAGLIGLNRRRIKLSKDVLPL